MNKSKIGEYYDGGKAAKIYINECRKIADIKTRVIKLIEYAKDCEKGGESSPHQAPYTEGLLAASKEMIKMMGYGNDEDI